MGKQGRSFGRTMWPSVGSPPQPRHVLKVRRNEPCPCGSGKKYKDCHEREGEAYLQKLARVRDKEHLRQVRAQLKASGVPWYKRLFIRL